jgi:hypothetical protein
LWCCIAAGLENDDKSLLSGTDTESTLVLVAMCVGGTIVFAKFVLELPVLSPVFDATSRILLVVFAPAGRRGIFFVVPIPLDPPVALRI